MFTPLAAVCLLLAGSVARPAVAQERLTLADATARARAGHVEARLAALREADAREGVTEARAGWLPRVDASEGWQRGNQPVFVFGSLLGQRRFSERDFDVAALNRPDPLDNFRAALTVEQVLFDGGLVAARRSAALGVEAATLTRRQVAQQVTSETIGAYGRVVLLDALAIAARSAVESAEADVVRARNRRDVGLATDADVLAADVQLASMRERDIETASEAGIAQASLNRLIGAPLDRRFELDRPPGASRMAAPPTGRAGDAVPDEPTALAARPDVQLAAVRTRLADAALAGARASFLPQAAARGAVEWNGATFGSRERAWVLGGEVRLNLFRGLADRARVTRTRLARDERAAEQEDAQIRARLDIRAAQARVDAARARHDVAAASVTQARESHRILRDRYDAGLTDITSVLQAARSVLDAEARAIGAAVDTTVAEALLAVALGR